MKNQSIFTRTASTLINHVRYKNMEQLEFARMAEVKINYFRAIEVAPLVN